MSVRIRPMTAQQNARNRQWNAKQQAQWMRSSNRVIPLKVLQHAEVLQAIGRSDQVGDLFNDIMGIIPGWDQRPDWMKQIRIKPDPAKIVSAVSKVVPPAKAAQAVETANNYGFDFFYRTPGGNVPITPGMVASGYGNFPMFSRVQDTLSSIPWYVYAAGGVLLLVVLAKK